jgi:hypothetical protein
MLPWKYNYLFIFSQNIWYCCRRVKCPLFQSDVNQIWISVGFFLPPISKFTKIRPVGAALLHAHRRTDGHDEANMRFSRLIRTLLNLNNLLYLTKVIVPITHFEGLTGTGCENKTAVELSRLSWSRYKASYFIKSGSFLNAAMNDCF